MAAVDELVQQLEAAADPVTRAASQELVRALMEMHGAALERMLTVIGRNGAAGATIVDQLTRDELVASVLLLYDLHPVDLETRVRGALEKTRPYLKSHGGNVELVGIDEHGGVRLRMQGSCHGCPSSAVTLKLAIEQAIYEAAPDVSAIVVEGQPANGHPAAPGLVTLASGGNGHGDSAAWRDVPELALRSSGETRRVELDGRQLLFCLLDESLYAYAASCPACGADLGPGSVAGRVLACPACGRTYDLVQAGRATDHPDLHLDPVPLLSRNGRTQVALPRPGVAAAPA
jgi:Fe-S cluster biogenesis protein NfuA/nitrite reductase/ring-hydroxylating ferredoxin subunit